MGSELKINKFCCNAFLREEHDQKSQDKVDYPFQPGMLSDYFGNDIPVFIKVIVNDQDSDKTKEVDKF